MWSALEEGDDLAISHRRRDRAALAVGRLPPSERRVDAGEPGRVACVDSVEEGTMKAPKWVKSDGQFFRLRPWHPSAWPMLWRCLDAPGALKPALFVVALARMGWAARR
jgi:hypothetical protein